MKFDKYLPAASLRPFVSSFAVSEQVQENAYTVFPSTGLVMGFQYQGKLSVLENGKPVPLDAAGISGIADHYKQFRNSAGTGTVLVYFTATGFAQFSRHPVHELFNQSVALDALFDKNSIAATEEKLSLASTDRQRVNIVAAFLLQQLKDRQSDALVTEAVQLIYESKGSIRIRDLREKLFISESPLEKRFRRIVGTSPKKFASIVRFQSVLLELGRTKSLAEICYENGFFDQAHFIHDFQRFTGNTPGQF